MTFHPSKNSWRRSVALAIVAFMPYGGVGTEAQSASAREAAFCVGRRTYLSSTGLRDAARLGRKRPRGVVVLAVEETTVAPNESKRNSSRSYDGGDSWSASPSSPATLENRHKIHASCDDVPPVGLDMSELSLDSLMDGMDVSLKDRCMISKAYALAREAPAEISGPSRRPSFVRAVGVARIIASMNLDAASVVAGLLTGVWGAGAVAKETVEEQFGAEIAGLVEDVADIGKIGYDDSAGHEAGAQAENFRRMILATANDVRAVLVKLAERTDEIRTLIRQTSQGVKEMDENRAVASLVKETLDIWAPLAHRLGIFKLKTELEDAALRLLRPEVYRELETMIAAKQEKRQAYTEEVISVLVDAMKAAGLNTATVSGRAKHIYSVFNKMQSKRYTLDEIEDLVAFRIICGDVAEVYQALGSVHGIMSPVPGRFKDYIAVPKPNGYQSLHTTVIGPRGRHIEVQIRTQNMHRIAEDGIAAHWIYKDKGMGNSRDDEEDSRRFSLLRQLVDWVRQPVGKGDGRATDPAQGKKLFEDEVFVFSPSGQLFAMRNNSTALDFAYRIHTHLGHGCVGARVNGRLVPLKHPLENGDTVEVLHSSQQTPQRDWLDIVQTSRARSRVRAWLKAQWRNEHVSVGKELFDKELRKRASRIGVTVGSSTRDYKRRLDRVLASYKIRDEDHLHSAIGQGHITVGAAVDVFFGESREKQVQKSRKKRAGVGESGDGHIKMKNNQPRTRKDGIVVGGERNVLIGFCRHCNPLRGESIGGLVTRGRGITVHRSSCQYMVDSDVERRIEVKWDPQTAATAKPRPVRVDIVFEDATGMLAKMSKAISSLGINIDGVIVRKASRGRGRARFDLMLSTKNDLDRVSRQLLIEDGVLTVERG